jgi:hypothetical protein
MGYDDIIRYLSNNVPGEMGYTDMLGWADDTIPNWRSNADMESQIKRIFRDMSAPSFEEGQRTLPEIVEDMESIREDLMNLPEPPTEEERGILGRAWDRIRGFLGRFF